MGSKFPAVLYRPVAVEGLRKYHNGNIDIPTAYFHPSTIVQWLFQARLKQALSLTRWVEGRNSCLDVGCGGGPLLPSLAGGFSRVIGLDRDIEPAAHLCRHADLKNVELVKENLFQAHFPKNTFDVIFAMDVVEHLNDVDGAMSRFSQWLAPSGVVIMCLPTENVLYELGRWFFGFTRPHDHYDMGPIRPLFEKYFKRVAVKSWPLPFFHLAQFQLWVGRKV